MLRKFIKRIIGWADQVSFVGLKGASLYQVLKGFDMDAISLRASGMAFNFFLALFPSFIFLFTLIPYISIEGVEDQVILEYLKFFPENIYETLAETITDTITNKRGELLSAGFFFAVIFAMNGVDAAIQAFNKTKSATFKKRNFLKRKLVSLLLLISVVSLLILSLSFLFIGGVVIDWLEDFGTFNGLLSLGLSQLFRWFMVFFMSVNMMSLLYYFGTSTTQRKSFYSLGSILAGIFSIITSVSFAVYVNNFGQYNKIYGSIGTVIALLLWLYINSMIILLGYELTQSIEQSKRGRLRS